jgi:hypothetical protein
MEDFDCYDEDFSFVDFDGHFPDEPYYHNYGPQYKWLTNTSDPSLEAHIARCKEEDSTFYKGDYSNLIAFPDAYDVFGRLNANSIAICRKLY